MRVGFVEWPEALEPLGNDWTKLTELIDNARLDLLVTNELPFGPWIAANVAFDREAAQASIDVHSKGLNSLSKLEVPAVLSSRPVWANDRLANQAFVTERGALRSLHHKQYFPEEPGWFESSWYAAGDDGFESAGISGVRVGVLLCTDAMFNEHARQYGRQGTDLIAIPRATGVSTDNWLAAGKMAAIVSGSYVVSSNRIGRSRDGVVFGGTGFAYHPDGSLFAVTTASETLLSIEVDPAVSARQRRSYPCYVTDPRFR
jgi:N-carbamoylputrescine amidase